MISSVLFFETRRHNGRPKNQVYLSDMLPLRLSLQNILDVTSAAIDENRGQKGTWHLLRAVNVQPSDSTQ